MAQKHRPRCRQQRATRFDRDEVGTHDEQPSASAHRVGVGPRGIRPHEGFQGALEILRVGGGSLIQDHEIDRQPLQPPILVGAKELANDLEIFHVVDPNQHDRDFA